MPSGLVQHNDDQITLRKKGFLEQVEEAIPPDKEIHF
jgi:hypothetical protein